MEWIPTADRMPPNGTPVLADTGHKHPIRACWVAKFSEEVGASDFDGDEDYDEKTDTSYWPEGWYEWNRYEETHWRVDVPVTHWMALPLPFNLRVKSLVTNKLLLLDLAAKAADLLIESYTEDGSAWVYPKYAKPNSEGEFDCKKWNPLEDDGDALRLASKLNICVEFGYCADDALSFGADVSRIEINGRCSRTFPIPLLQRDMQLFELQHKLANKMTDPKQFWKDSGKLFPCPNPSHDFEFGRLVGSWAWASDCWSDVNSAGNMINYGLMLGTVNWPNGVKAYKLAVWRFTLLFGFRGKTS